MDPQAQSQGGSVRPPVGEASEPRPGRATAKKLLEKFVPPTRGEEQIREAMDRRSGLYGG